jgi:uncharacterized tellurite resistance protein B-like protein
MLDKIKHWFDNFSSTEIKSEQSKKHRIDLAVAAVMVEMITIDNKISQAETEQCHQVLLQQLDLSLDEIKQLTDLAKQELAESVDYYQFTRLINDEFSQADKVSMIESLWKVAYADGKVDSYEEHYLRKIADLLFVSHQDFIKTKLKVLG